MPYRTKGFAAAQRARDYSEHPDYWEYSGDVCPDCNCPIYQEHGKWICHNEECDWVDEEPDIDDMDYNTHLARHLTEEEEYDRMVRILSGCPHGNCDY